MLVYTDVTFILSHWMDKEYRYILFSNCAIITYRVVPYSMKSHCMCTDRVCKTIVLISVWWALFPCTGERVSYIPSSFMVCDGCWIIKVTTNCTEGCWHIEFNISKTVTDTYLKQVTVQQRMNKIYYSERNKLCLKTPQCIRTSN